MSIWHSHDNASPHSAEANGTPSADGGAAGGEPASPPAAGTAADLLETNRNSVDSSHVPGGRGSFVPGALKVRAVGCKCRFCPDCCLARGLAMREKLRAVLATFSRIMMVTLTIDPTLFASPLEAFEYVRKRRAVAEFVRALRKAGHLDSERYFYVVEWQQHTEMPHYHLLIETSFVPHHFMEEIWGRNRPGSAGPVEVDRPTFGYVHFIEQGDYTSEYAACYLSKYLMKYPAYGFPCWVLDYPGQIKRCSGSRGLWGTPPRRQSTRRKVPKRRQRTIRQRIARCGCMAILVDCEPTTPDKKRARFVARLRVPFQAVANTLRRGVPVGRYIPVSLAEARMLEQGSRTADGEKADTSAWHPEMELTREGVWIVHTPHGTLPAASFSKKGVSDG